MTKKEFERALKNILAEIKDVPDSAKVTIEYYTLEHFDFSPVTNNPEIHLDYDDEMFMTVENKEDCANLRVIIINSKD